MQVEKPLTFTVDLNGAKGDLYCTLNTPSGGHEDCFMQEIDRGIWAIRVIPRENGIYYVDIRLNEAHIPDSPFAMMVGSVAADPAMVHASGEGLEFGKTGNLNIFTQHFVKETDQLPKNKILEGSSTWVPHYL